MEKVSTLSGGVGLFSLKGELIFDASSLIKNIIEEGGYTKAVISLDLRKINEEGLVGLLSAAVHFNLHSGGICLVYDQVTIKDLMLRAKIADPLPSVYEGPGETLDLHSIAEQIFAGKTS